MSQKLPPTPESIRKAQKLVSVYSAKSGTTTHPNSDVTNAVIDGLARNMDELGRPLCPCRFYPDKAAEAKHRTWICACDDMQIYKYCHCLLFLNAAGEPITEHLPEDHEGRTAYGLIKDPTPEMGRPLRALAAERELERKSRPS
jgi:ferredoxin-thioredoxin reductase catalytic chain